MATRKLCIATVLLSLHATNSYILLTANLDDVHSIAKQIAQSPVARQLDKFIRRASSVFNQQFNKGGRKMHLRADPKMDDTESDEDNGVWKPDPKDKIALRSRMSDSSASEISGEANDNKANRVEGKRLIGIEEKQQIGIESKEQVKVEEKPPVGVETKQQELVEEKPPVAERRDHVGLDRRYHVGADSIYQVGADSKYQDGADSKYQVKTDSRYLVGAGKRHQFAAERRNQAGQDLLELGKNASFYLKSIKKIFENF